MKVAIVHDYLTQRGGAERVVLSLLRAFPGADLYTSVYDPDGTYPEFRDVEVRTSFLQRLPHRGDAFRALLPLYPLAFGRMRLEGHDLVVSSSSGWAHGVRAPGALHLCYCHTPPRFLHQTDRYLARGVAPGVLRPALGPVLAALRRWDRTAATRPDAYVANSRAVADRIRTAYGREAELVHPPVDVERVVPGPPPGPDAPYLVVARLLPYKRTDLAVRVCTERRSPLVVVGDGPERRRLEALAGPGVRFLRGVSDDELLELLRSCRALIQPGEEDFGIAPLEANAAGRPTVAYRGGGALETVRDGETGVLFDAQTPEALSRALDRLEAGTWAPQRLRVHAEGFSEAAFVEGLWRVVRGGRGRPGPAPTGARPRRRRERVRGSWVPCL